MKTETPIVWPGPVSPAAMIANASTIHPGRGRRADCTPEDSFTATGKATTLASAPAKTFGVVRRRPAANPDDGIRSPACRANYERVARRERCR